MLNTRTMTTKEAQELLNRGADALCVVTYEYANYRRGDILSWHKSYDAAARAIRRLEKRLNRSYWHSILNLDSVDEIQGITARRMHERRTP